MIKIVFFGTGRFAEIILRKLILEKELVEIVAVVTKIDKPADRHLNQRESLVKTLAIKNNLNILQPVNLKDLSFTKTIKDFDDFLIIVTDYGKIIPQEILDLASHGAINVHPSLLPKYRGPSPIQTAILSGDDITGTTIMLIDQEIDHGPIIYQKEIPIEKADDVISLEQKLANLSVLLLIKTIKDIRTSSLKTYEQNHSQATFSKIIKKEDGLISWNDEAEVINQKIKAFLEWPTSFTNFMEKDKNKLLKIVKAKVIIHESEPGDSELVEPGKLFIIEKDLAISCGKHCIILERVLPEGKREMTGYQWYLGHPGISFLGTKR
jgi:methionyl-tRNA formyltransferase